MGVRGGQGCPRSDRSAFRGGASGCGYGGILSERQIFRGRFAVKRVVSFRNGAGYGGISRKIIVWVLCFYCVSSVFFREFCGGEMLAFWNGEEQTVEDFRQNGAVRGAPKRSRRRFRFHGNGAGEGGTSARRCASIFSGMIRNPVPTGFLVSHVGLRRQRTH